MSVKYIEIPAYDDKKANIKFMGIKGYNLKRITNLLKIDKVWLDLEKNVIRLYSNNLKKFSNAKKYFEKYLQRFYDKNIKIEDVVQPNKKRRLI